MESKEQIARKMEVAPASPDDARGITTVLYKAWLDTYPNEEYSITKDDIEESYKDAFTEESLKKQQEKISHLPENQKQIVVKMGDEVIGISTMIRETDHNKLKTIYVLPEYQKRGVGKMLWEEVSKFCDPTKDTVVQLAIYNDKARKFYEKLGFVDTGKRWDEQMSRMKKGITIPAMEMVLKAKSNELKA